MAEWVPKEYEKTWNDAKASFIKSYNKEPKNEKDWATVAAIYKKMGGKVESKAEALAEMFIKKEARDPDDYPKDIWNKAQGMTVDNANKFLDDYDKKTEVFCMKEILQEEDREKLAKSMYKKSWDELEDRQKQTILKLARKLKSEEVCMEFFDSSAARTAVGDVERLKASIAAELDAASLYNLYAQQTDNEIVKQVMLSVQAEEETHMGEFIKVLKKLQPDFMINLMAGENEVGQTVKTPQEVMKQMKGPDGDAQILNDGTVYYFDVEGNKKDMVKYPDYNMAISTLKSNGYMEGFGYDIIKSMSEKLYVLVRGEDEQVTVGDSALKKYLKDGWKIVNEESKESVLNILNRLSEGKATLTDYQKLQDALDIGLSKDLLSNSEYKQISNNITTRFRQR